MPAQISHCLAAEAALLRSAPELARAWGIGAEGGGPGARESPVVDTGKSPAAWFRLGAQGPDIFYHNQRTKPSGLHYGALAHNRNYGLIVEGALEALLASGAPPDSREAAWLLGFATHAALDRAIHPFIVFFSGWARPQQPETTRYRACHPFFERLLDLVILERERGLGPAQLDLETLLPLGEAEPAGTEEDGAPAGIEGRIGTMLGRGLGAAFPRSVASDFLLDLRIANALADARFFFRVTNPARTAAGDRGFLAHFDDREGSRAIALLYPDSLPPDLDLANDARVAWEHPAGDGRTSTADFHELWEAGVSSAAEGLGRLLDSIARGGPAPGLSAAIGNGGLSIVDTDGVAVPPRLSRPLPLHELMESEFARRLEQARRLAPR